MKKYRKLTALALIIALLLSLTGCASNIYEYIDSKREVVYYDPSGENVVTVADDTSGDSGAEREYNTVQYVDQLTEEDIDEMNGGKALFVYNDEGFISTIIGKYYTEKVNDYEDAVESLRGIQSIIGMSAGSEFFCVYGTRDDDGYTYYTFQQRYGGYTLKYGTLKVIVDPEGYTAGMTTSFTPNAGICEETDAISASKAESIVEDLFAEYELEYYRDATSRIAVTFNNVTYSCWAVYTNNPEESISFEMPYLEHYVTIDGTYVTVIPTSSLETSNTDAFKTDSYFEPMETLEYSRSIKMGDGSVKTVNAVISRNKNDGLYYLCDPDRKIIVAQYYDFYYGNTLSFVTSTTGDDWSDNNLMAYVNYCTAYDYYAQRGLYSVDGFGTPILVTVGYCDKDGTPVDNACYYGNNSGWACFAVSDVNIYSMSLDCCAHEYTHGVTKCSMQGNFYCNETGAINEAYSDIMGNLCEMASGFTTDSDWLLLETSGEVMRSMSQPGDYCQPEFVGDEYYTPSLLYPDSSINDLGGVHTDSSLLSRLAYVLNEEGMTFEQQFSLWTTSIEMLTPLADYDDLHAILLFSCTINGLTDFGSVINSYFSDTGLNSVRSETYLEAERAGYGRITFSVDAVLASSPVYAQFYTSDGQLVADGYPDENGNISVLVPAGDYAAFFGWYSNGSVSAYAFTSDGWRTAGSANAMIFEVPDGKSVYINNINTGSSEGTGGSSGSGETEPSSDTGSSSGLTLTEYTGDHFTMTAPKGWTVEQSKAGETFWVRLTNPDRPSEQIFYYNLLQPLLKSEQAKSLYRLTDYTGIFSNCPVLTARHSEGILLIWDEIRNYQLLMGSGAVFTKLYNITPVQTEYFEGPLTQYGAIESNSVAACSTDYDSSCTICLSSAVYDAVKQYVDGVDTGYLALFNVWGIVGADEYINDDFSTLLSCINSISFDTEYFATMDGETENPELWDGAAVTPFASDGAAGKKTDLFG